MVKSGPIKWKLSYLNRWKEQVNQLVSQLWKKVVYKTNSWKLHQLEVINYTITDDFKITMSLGSALNTNGKRKIEFTTTFSSINELASRMMKFSQEWLKKITTQSIWEKLEPNDRWVDESTIMQFRTAQKRFKSWRRTDWKADLQVNEQLCVEWYWKQESVNLFFQGETVYDLQKGNKNTISNPLWLIKPRILMSLSEFSKSYPSYSAEKCRSTFMFVTKKYEQMACFVIESLNNPDDISRQKDVLSYLKEFSDRFNLQKSKNHKPLTWLFLIVMSIIKDKSLWVNEIWRRRALCLLSWFRDSDLLEFFKNPNNSHLDWYFLWKTQPLPKIFWTKNEWQNPNSWFSWRINTNIIWMIKYVDWKIDAKKSWYHIITSYPKEAMQIAILFLQKKQTAPIWIWIFQTINKMWISGQTALMKHYMSYWEDWMFKVTNNTNTSTKNTNSIHKKTSKDIMDELQKENEQLKIAFLEIAKSLLHANKELTRLRKLWNWIDISNVQNISLRKRAWDEITKTQLEVFNLAQELKTKDTRLQDTERTVTELKAKISVLSNTIIQLKLQQQTSGKTVYSYANTNEQSPIDKYHSLLWLSEQDLLNTRDKERISVLLSAFKKAKQFQFHPDMKWWDSEKFKEIENAYQQLIKYYSTKNLKNAA